MNFFEFFLFPGLIFTVFASFLVSWIDRKITALVQWRVGPPFFQPVYDFFKLMKKETLVPKGANTVLFLFAPLLSFSSLLLVAIVLAKTNLEGIGFSGDLFVVVYLLLLPPFSVITGASASANPLASLGASREMKMVLSYELPFILALITVIINTGGSICLGEIIAYQRSSGVVMGSFSGFIALIVTIFCFQSKMAQVPFDLPEAEQEIMGGALIEYSGPPLGFFALSRWMMMAIFPFLAVILFWGGISSPAGILKYLLILVIVILIKNTNPRLRIGQMLRFFWGPLTAAGAIGVILAVIGL